jgi:hypothetical protein
LKEEEASAHHNQINNVVLAEKSASDHDDRNKMGMNFLLRRLKKIQSGSTVDHDSNNDASDEDSDHKQESFHSYF